MADGIHFFSLYQAAGRCGTDGQPEKFFASPPPTEARKAPAHCHYLALKRCEGPRKGVKSDGRDKRAVTFAAFGEWAKAIGDIKPDLLVFSAGLDAYEGDPLGELRFTEDDYRELSEMFTRACGGPCPIVSLLEGGYK